MHTCLWLQEGSARWTQPAWGYKEIFSRDMGDWSRYCEDQCSVATLCAQVPYPLGQAVSPDGHAYARLDPSEAAALVQPTGPQFWPVFPEDAAPQSLARVSPTRHKQAISAWTVALSKDCPRWEEKPWHL